MKGETGRPCSKVVPQAIVGDMPRVSDTYQDLAELLLHEVEGEAFRIRTVRRASPVLTMAPHGGTIEVGTSTIAEAIAEDSFSFYSFEGLVGAGEDETSSRLHVTSTQFDEPQVRALLKKADVVIAVHGADETREAFTMVGGRDRALGERIAEALREKGYDARLPRKGLHGIHPENIVNRGRSGAGVQLEVTRKLRDEFWRNPDALTLYAATVRAAIEE